MTSIHQLPNSIVNADSTSYADSVTPYPYLTFITFFSTPSTTEMVNLYNEYVREWHSIKSQSNSVESYNNTIKQKYIDLFNSINLNYTNLEEQRFLTNLDITNAHEADLLIPFYINKINDITEYFIEKRDNIKFAIQKNATSNSKQGIIQQLKTFIIDQIQHNNTFQEIDDYTLDTLTTNLEVDIQEKYDTFSFNYDVSPDSKSSDYIIKNELYKKYFNNNVLDFNKLDFVDEQSYILQVLKEYPVFIKEFGFSFSTVAADTDISNFKSKDFISQSKSSKYDDLNSTTYKDIAIRYAGTDMYYVSNNTTGKLFNTYTPYANILNKKHTTIPSVPAENFENKRTVGNYYLPNKQGFVVYNTYNKDYSLQPTTEYVQFPDPDVCGNIYGTSLVQISGYPYVYNTSIADTYFEKLYSNITGILNTNTYQTFHGYLNDIPQDYNLVHNFEQLYQLGTIYTYKTDIYGNEYAFFKQHSIIAPDNISSFKAKYTPSLTDDNTSNIQENKWLWVFDGNTITTKCENAITSDNELWPVFSPISAYPYDILLEAGQAQFNGSYIQQDGIYKGKPYKPSIIPNNIKKPQLLTYSLYNNVMSSCVLYDGGNFNTKEYVQDSSYYVSIPYVKNNSTQYHTTTSQLLTGHSQLTSNIYKTRRTSGVCMVRYNNSSNIVPLSNILDFIKIDNNTSLNDIDITGVDVIQDVIIIRYKQGIIFNKIYINNNGLISKSSIPVRIINTVSNNHYLSRYFYDESNNTILFAIIKNEIFNLHINGEHTTQNILYPTLYKISLNDLHCDIIYDIDGDEKELVKYTINQDLISHILQIDEPIIFYNSLNNAFDIIFYIHDWLGFSHLINQTFVLQHNKIELITNDLYLSEDIKVSKI